MKNNGTPFKNGQEATAPESNIQVFVRCRPLKTNGTEKRSVVHVCPEGREVRVQERIGGAGPGYGSVAEKVFTKNFFFDGVFSENNQQIDVYRSVVLPLIDQVLMGYNCTVFAYGQTGTGKTFTMEGERSDDTLSWEEDPKTGIIPRALAQLFETLRRQDNEFTVRVSFLELYNEEIFDLLSPIDDTTKLRLFEDSTKKGSVIVAGLEEITVNNKKEIYDILRRGTAKRTTAATNLNERSSRSHTVFTVTCHIKESTIEGEELVKTGKLNLVDLAGSENIGRSGAVEKRAREAGNINQSLLTLGRVITSLVEKAPHVPYRESKLTRLLQDSLGGRTKTSIIATVSPSLNDVEDTLSTLDYAYRAKRITNKPEINQKMSKKTLLREYTSEIERLRRDLVAAREKNGLFISEDNYKEMTDQIEQQAAEIKEKEEKIKAFEEEIAKITALFQETTENLRKTSEELQQTAENLGKTTQILVETEKNLEEVSQDRDEQKHLKEQHVKTEDVLSTQARQILTTADMSVDHVVRLHDKVSRVKSVEEQNFARIYEYQEHFAKKMNNLEDWISVAASSLQERLDEAHNDLKGKVQSVGSLLSNLSGLLNTTLSNFNEHHSSLSNTAEGVNPMVAKLSEMVDIVVSGKKEIEGHTSVLTDKLAKSLEENTVLLHRFQSAVNESRQQMEYLVLQQLEAMHNIKTMRSETFQSLMAKIETDRKQIVEQVGTLRGYIAEQEKERMSGAQREAEVIKQMRNLLGQLEAERSAMSQKLSKRVEENTQYTHQIVSTMNILEEEEKTAMKDAVKALDTEQDKVVKLVENYDQVNGQLSGALIRQTMDLTEKQEEAYNETVEQINKMRQITVNTFDKTEVEGNSLSAMMKEHSSTLSTQIGEVGKEMNVKLMEGLSTMKGLEASKDSLGASVDENIQEVKSRAEVNEKSHIREIDSRRSSFSRFVECELVKDAPTGQTPQRCPFEYPRDLAQTSPHERILARFRAARQPPSTEEEIAADAKSNDGVESSISSRSSSQLSVNGYNNENNAPSEDRPNANDSGAGDPSLNLKNVTKTLFKDDEINSSKSNPGSNKSNPIISSAAKSSGMKPLKTANK